MEALEDGDNAVGSDSAVTSFSGPVTIARESQNSFIANESKSNTQQDSITGIDPCLTRSGFQYSTDLSKELSLDVLASLGDAVPSADDGKSPEDPLLELANVSASDMEFISELSSFNLRLEHVDPDDPVASHTFATPSRTASELGHISVEPEALALAHVSHPTLPHNVAPCAALPVRLSQSDPVALKLTAPSGTIVDAVSTTGTALVDDALPGSILVSSAHHASASGHISDPTSEPPPCHASENLPEATSAGLPISGHDLTSASAQYEHPQMPVDIDAPETPSSTFASPIVDPVSSVSFSTSFHSTPLSSDAAVVPMPAFPVASDAFVNPDDGDIAMPTHKHHLSGDKLPTETGSVSHETSPTFEILSTAPGDPLVANTDAALSVNPLVEMNLPFLDQFAKVSVSGAVKSANVPPLSSISLGSSVVSSSSVLSYSSAFNPHVVPLNSTLPGELETAVVDSTLAVPSPLLTTRSPPSFRSPMSDPTPISSGPALNVRNAYSDDPGLSFPDTARVWDLPSTSGLSISSSVSLSAYFDESRLPVRGRKSVRKRRSSEAGTDLKDTKGKSLSDAEINEDVEELERMIEMQKKMLHWQIDEVQRITALQCQLTGINPLSEDLMWDVVGVKGGGKLSGDAFSPEALKCLQEIFAVKDTLTKKEARDISISTGASLIQVREYFAAQRSLVRKLVQQAHDEAGRLGIRNASEHSEEITVSNTISEFEKDIGFYKLAGTESLEKLTELMWAEKSFAGQVQLLQVILHTDSSALILRRLLEKGALKLLGGWLVEAASEEQSSVVCHLLKVLDHLPMSSAVPHQMPPLVQNVNKLRFYHVLDVAAQARTLLAKWSKMFLPKSEGVKLASSPRNKLTIENAPSKFHEWLPKQEKLFPNCFGMFIFQ